MKLQLQRVKQCVKCPWKKSTNPQEIEGYCKIKHQGLKDTIAEPASLKETNRAMACHHSDGFDGMYCVGWLMNQLGPGNNIPLRIKMLSYDLSKLKTTGPQHKCFEDTLREATND